MMKFISYLIIFLALIITGCEDRTDTSIGPIQDGQIELLKLPGQQTFTTNKIINGDTGGELLIDTSYAGGPFGLVKIYSRIVFPPGYYQGDVDISMTIDDAEAILIFEPSMMFDSSATLNISFEGLDLRGVNPSTINFVYLNDDGSTTRVNRKDLKVIYGLGKIQLEDAVIPHFTRLAFAR